MNRTTLNKATSPDPSPTPGYLFDEIAKVTHDPLGNDRLVEYLIKRLESPSADVKAKVLNIIKHVCRKGNASFRRAWQRESPAIKAHLQYHTAPDPLRGDEPSKRVREAAKEALEAVFDASKDERKADPNLASRIQGFGVAPPAPAGQNLETTHQSRFSTGPTSAPSYQSSAPVSSAPRFSSGSRYEGIGNPNFQDPRNQPKTFMERVADAVREKVEKHAENIPGVGGVKPPWMTQNGGQDMPGDYNYASNRGYGNYASTTGTYDPTASQRTSSIQASTATWSDPRSPRPMVTVSGMPIASTVPNGAQSATARHRTAEPSDGTYERSLVEELCAPGGVRPLPPKDKLDSFCKACRTLDPNWIITLLDEKMAEDDWKVQHKALCVIEALLQMPGLDAYADRLDQTPDNLEALYNSRNPSVKERAQKVWKLLYEDGEGNGNNNNHVQAEADLVPDYSSTSSQPASSFPTTRAAAAPEMNLLDFDASPSVPIASQPSPPPVPQSSSSSLNSMFGNLNLKQPSSSSNPSSSMGAGSMFGNLNVKSASTPTAAGSGSAPTAAAPPSNPSGFSFLSSSPGNVARQSPPPPATSSSLLGMPMSTTMMPPPFSSNNNNLDIFSLELGSAAAAAPPMGQQPQNLMMFSPVPQTVAKPSGMGMNASKPPMGQAQQPAKKPDSFNFVQEALRKV